MVSSWDYVGDNSPFQAFVAATETGWQPTQQEVGAWLQMKVFTVRENHSCSPTPSLKKAKEI